jgi:hypothetical protein
MSAIILAAVIENSCEVGDLGFLDEERRDEDLILFPITKGAFRAESEM